MEELRKLEQLHTTLTFMQSHNFVPSSTLDSNRFIANLILLLLQPCGELNLDMKLRLLSEYLPKFWTLNIYIADYQEVNDPSGKKDCLPLQINHEEVAMVGLEAMERANSTLEDFCRSYFMFHGVDIDSPLMIFKYFPVLAFTESYIYQLDGLNEKILSIPTEGDTSLAKEFEKMNYQCCSETFANMLEKDPFRPLLNVLELRGLLTDRIREEFRSGEEYWALERKLCRALTHKMEISIKDVMRAIHLKSFDYRVLNLLLYQLRGQEVNDLHMEFLSVSEFLDDVLENNFNILRMFVKIYGPSTAPAMLAKYITDAEERYGNLLKTLDPQLSSKYQRRCEEATKEGGTVSGHPLGTWSIPPVIVNEDLYRSNCLNTE
ncbi:ATP synthase subunit b 2 [Gossypium australe]|uniref:ATP synthase subunit b 2 n=1 Tax=Gossypium australe TaxID=47621 RepID=A0A5B6WF03_9ROSI|nr:ATP synthase subunit b 2 [Gossypium australe]